MEQFEKKLSAFILNSIKETNERTTKRNMDTNVQHETFNWQPASVDRADTS